MAMASALAFAAVPAVAAPGGDAVIEAAPLTVAVNANGGAAAMCPSGQRAVGGGIQPMTPATGPSYNAYRIAFTGPVDETGTTAATDDGDIPRGWLTYLTNIGADTSFRVYAVCSATSDAVLEEETVLEVDTATTTRLISCPSGGRAIGGGVGTTTSIPASNSTAQPYGVTSLPVDATGTVAGTQTGDVPTKWRTTAGFGKSSPGGGATFKYYAVCSASSDAVVQADPFTVTAPPTDPVNAATATCPTGTRALSGGVGTDDPPPPPAPSNSYRIQRNGPLDETGVPANTDDGDVARSWYGAERFATPSGSASFRTIAVCATDDVPPPPDTTPPQTSITKHPGDKIKSGKATYAFKSSEAGSTFECALDTPRFKACTSPVTYRNLKTGKHTFSVRATDASDNTDPTPATDSFKRKRK